MLFQYLLHLNCARDDSAIEDYLRQKLFRNLQEGDVNAAATIDHNQSMVRLVYSDRAGMGNQHKAF